MIRPHQQICKACDKIITLPKPTPAIEYCLRCTEEINAFYDDSSITDAELDDWADLWESQGNR